MIFANSQKMNRVPDLHINQPVPRGGSILDATGAASMRWDRLGFVASSLCAVHCVCMPWLLAAMPFLAGSVFASREAEHWFVAGSVFLAIACTVGGCRVHRHWWLIGVGVVGAAVLVAAHASAPAICCVRDISWPHASGSAFGGGLLAATHFLNLRQFRRAAGPKSEVCCNSSTCIRNHS